MKTTPSKMIVSDDMVLVPRATVEMCSYQFTEDHFPVMSRILSQILCAPTSKDSPSARDVKIRQCLDRVERLMIEKDISASGVFTQLRTLLLCTPHLQGDDPHAWISRSELEEFMVQYHAQIWEAAEESSASYDEAGAELFEQFITRFD